jgi:nucleotide-binding universal stress UspA family protein
LLPEEFTMIDVLAPVRADHDQRWALNCLTELNQREPIRVHLLSVQPHYSGHVRMFVSPTWINEVQQEDGQQELAPMCRELDARGIPYERHVVEGSSAEQIARAARQHHCAQIVMGPPAAGHLSDRVFGSLNRQVEQLLQQAGEACVVR